MAFEKGNKLGKGRPPKVEEEKANNLFMKALSEIYETETDEQSKIEFIKNVLMPSQRGQLFIAEHIFGKPKETIDQNVNVNNFDIKELFKFDNSKE
jgi:hypothetical protein